MSFIEEPHNWPRQNMSYVMASVILDEVHAVGVAHVELECQATWSIDMDRVSRGLEVAERVELPSWHVHVADCRSRVQSREALKKPEVVDFVDLRGLPALEKFGSPLV